MLRAHGLRDGYHRVVLDDGSTYDGEWRDGQRWGFGSQTFALTQNVYRGEWEDGRWHGRGLLCLANGQWYDGNWVEGRRDGFGTEESDCERYAGEWCRDERCGTGIVTDASGKAWDVFYSTKGELVWKHHALGLEPLTVEVVWTLPDEPRFTPKKVNFIPLLSSLASPRILPKVPAAVGIANEEGGRREIPLDDENICGEAFIKATLVWERNVRSSLTSLSISESSSPQSQSDSMAAMPLSDEWVLMEAAPDLQSVAAFRPSANEHSAWFGGSFNGVRERVSGLSGPDQGGLQGSEASASFSCPGASLAQGAHARPLTALMPLGSYCEGGRWGCEVSVSRTGSSCKDDALAHVAHAAVANGQGVKLASPPSGCLPFWLGKTQAPCLCC
jgi:hypothetical protein